MNQQQKNQMMEEIQKRFSDMKPELASQIILAETLKLCKNIMDMTKLPVNPKVLNLLLHQELIDEAEHQRLINILDPQSKPE